LFNSLVWDTSDVTDKEFSLFLKAKLQGKYTYMLDFGQGKRITKNKLRIIRAEEHPHFSPEWLTTNHFEDDILDRELTINDLGTQSVVAVLHQIIEAPHPPPPPPPPTGDEHT
jgi:hypothetical protein